MKELVRKLLNRYWILRMLAFLIFRPKRFMSDFYYPLKDYQLFRKSIFGYQKFIANNKPIEDVGNHSGLLIVAGVMSAQWCQLWGVLAAAYQHGGVKAYSLTSKGQPIQNLYFRLFGIEPIYIEDMAIEQVSLPEELANKIANLKEFDEIKFFEYDNAPIGKMALSTYSRVKATGIMDIDNPEAVAEVRWWMRYLCKAVIAAEQLYQRYDISTLFFTELFMDFYGGFYYAALESGRNISRFASTVRDEAIVVTHQTKKNDRTHFSSIDDDSWSFIEQQDFHQGIQKELDQNFADRYSDRWAMSSRNQPNTKKCNGAKARSELGIKADRKVAIIYSHILYDTLFFNGEYLFKNYADWLVQSIKAACENPEVDWYVKIHPSNLWRGELEYFLDGIYEEERLIREFVGKLPEHVKLIFPDTPYSPYTWLEIADYGITVTGTSGIELGALGKAVITAGTGRYEKIGFTINSESQEEYLDVLRNVHKYDMPNSHQHDLGKKFAYATFCLKPFTLSFLKPKPKFGKQKIYASEDLVYVGNFGSDITSYPEAIVRFIDWNANGHKVDLLNPWPTLEK